MSYLDLLSLKRGKRQYRCIPSQKGNTAKFFRVLFKKIVISIGVLRELFEQVAH